MIERDRGMKINQEFKASSSLSYMGPSFNSDDDMPKNQVCTSITLLKCKDCIRGTN